MRVPATAVDVISTVKFTTQLYAGTLHLTQVTESTYNIIRHKRVPAFTVGLWIPLAKSYDIVCECGTNPTVNPNSSNIIWRAFTYNIIRCVSKVQR